MTDEKSSRLKNYRCDCKRHRLLFRYQKVKVFNQTASFWLKELDDIMLEIKCTACKKIHSIKKRFFIV